MVARRDGYRLVQNHEITPGYGDTPVVPLTEGTVYDEGAEGGGCTVLDVDRGARRRSEWVGLSGTVGNCAGGETPWGSWLTCEETEARAGTANPAGGTYAKDHGYVFEVFPDRPEAQLPLPIECWGRAPHEAVVIEPSRRRVYLTEDASRPTGLIYRWSAPGRERVGPRIAERFGRDAGVLEAMAVTAPDGSVLPDLAYATSAQIGRPWSVSWTSVPDRHASTTSLRSQLGDGEVTRSKKLEGAWSDGRGMYFAASFAYPADIPADATPHDGQLWYLEYATSTLTLKAYYPYLPARDDDDAPGWEERLGLSTDLAFDGPDNVHVSPYGAVIMSEDGTNAQHALSWTPEHGTQAVARNAIVLEQNDRGGNVYSEMTGPCFSPDGKFLFVNVQEPGHVFAITGPWKTYLG